MKSKLEELITEFVKYLNRIDDFNFWLENQNTVNQETLSSNLDSYEQGWNDGFSQAYKNILKEFNNTFPKQT